MSSSSSSCENTADIITDAGGKYRFFNQPLEQIPGFLKSKPQILAHAPDGGLMWFTLDQCMPVVTCFNVVEGESGQALKADRRNIVVIKDFEIAEDDCQVPLPASYGSCACTGTGYVSGSVDVITGISLESEGLVATKTRIHCACYEPIQDTDVIPIISCPENP